MKKIIVLVLALAMVCFAFTGCIEQYSDTKPMSEKRVEKLMEDKGDQVEKNIDNWDSIELTVDLEVTMDGATDSQKYTTILDTKTKTYKIDMSQIDKTMGVVYLKGNYGYYDMPGQGKVKVDMSSAVDLNAFIDMSSQKETYLFPFEEMDAGKLAEYDVKVFVTKTDDGGELYRFAFTKEYYEYMLEEGPSMKMLEAMGGDISEARKLVTYEVEKFNQYEMTYEFNKKGELVEIKEFVDVTVSIDMTKLYGSMGITSGSGVPMSMTTASKGESTMRMTDEKIEINEAEYRAIG